MSDWASPILVVPKEEECADTRNNAGSSRDGKFNLQLWIDYRKLNSWIQTALQIKADGSLGKVLALCTEFALNYLNDIMISSETWQEHLEHLEEVVKWLQDADLKIKHSKCKFFKTKVYYLGFLVGIYGVQPLPEKVTAIEALEPPKDINELCQVLGLIGFYRKFVPFFVDITACLNTMQRNGAVFKWTEQCGNAFKLLESELVKMPTLQYPNPNKPFMLFTDASRHSYSSILHQERHPTIQMGKSTSFLLLIFQGLLVGPNNCGTLPKMTVTWSTNPFKNLHSTLQAQNAHCIVTSNH